MNYDSNMNSHAIVKGNIKDLKFDIVDSTSKCIYIFIIDFKIQNFYF
jgi:hypothetical protein